MITNFLLVLMGSAILNGVASAQVGNSTVARWKDNKKGAFTLRFDDSMWSHHDHAIPNLVKRELTGSFFLNPALERYGYGIDTWESLASRAGMELCPHTMYHLGAADFDEAEYEIGESFKIVWSLNPPDKSRLCPFHRGGGTTWPSDFIEVVQKKYPVADYTKECSSYNGQDNRTELINFAKNAIEDEKWNMILSHGTGPNLEYLGFEVSNFEALLDYLVSIRDKLWIGTIGDIYKYITERKTAKIGLIENNGKVIRLDLSSDTDPVYYDYPLTLITEVPAQWEYCHVNQGKRQGIYPVQSGKVMYDALPNRGEIVLKSSSMDLTPPVKFMVRDGTGEDINISSSTTEVSANWDAGDDPESGISGYWYKIGTTPGGSEVLDWINNGRQQFFATSRTNLALTRGKKYYVTVKSVNGVGLECLSTSDGFIVGSAPNYISFNENFDNGRLSQWDQRKTKIGHNMSILYISDKAARSGQYGLLCHFQENTRLENIFIANQDVTIFRDIFTRFWFRMSSDFKMQEGNLKILELRDESGESVADVSIGYEEVTGFYIYGTGMNDNGEGSSLPACSRNYPLSFVHLEKEKWHRIDLRTVAEDGKGSIEFWFDGKRKGCIKNQFTVNKKVNSLAIGAISLSAKNMSGDIYFDDISISDSLLD